MISGIIPDTYQALNTSEFFQFLQPNSKYIIITLWIYREENRICHSIHLSFSWIIFDYSPSIFSSTRDSASSTFFLNSCYIPSTVLLNFTCVHQLNDHSRFWILQLERSTQFFLYIFQHCPICIKNSRMSFGW